MLILKQFFIGSLLFLLSAVTQADVVLRDMEGQTISFASLKGKWVFINYWASWCRPCLEEIPELNEFYQTHKEGNVVLFGVNYDALPLNEQKTLIEEYNILFPNLSHDPANLLRLGPIRGVPATFVFNPKGKLVKKIYGGQTADSLSTLIS